MRVFKCRGGSRYLYKFKYQGIEYYRSTGTENRREPEILAAAARVRIVRQAAGLEEPEPPRRRGSEKDERKPVPTLRQFESPFVAWVSITKSEQKGTLSFYRENYRKLLAYGPWADLGLDQINEAHIEAFKAWALKYAGRRRDGRPTPALRHTFLTQAGEYTDPFTLQYVAGHDTIKTTMRYVHPREETVRKLFVRLGGLEQACARNAGSVQALVQSHTTFPEPGVKSQVPSSLQRAEVVELADTPS